jgi:hypothetical protein
MNRLGIATNTILSGKMIVPNLNPAQMAAARRPMSASLRTPRGGDKSFERLRSDGQATPRAKAVPEVPEGQEEPWLFRFGRSLTTMDVWKMGFSRVIIFGAHHWADASTAGAEIAEAFGSHETLSGLSAEHKDSLESMISPSFLRGDVLIAVQCSQCAMLPEDEKMMCISNAAKLIDAISNVWTQYDQMGENDLGAVVVVMEGLEAETLIANWTPDDIIRYPVTELDEEFSVFFK